MSATSGLTRDEAVNDREIWGQLVESAVGAHLASAAPAGSYSVSFSRERYQEVDFVVQTGRRS